MRTFRIIIAILTLTTGLLVVGNAWAQANPPTPAGVTPPSQCFRPDECGQGKYKNSFPVASKECAPFPPFTHNCIASAPPVKLNVPLGGNTEIVGLQKYIIVVYKLLIGSAGILAGIMITLAGFEWLTARGDSGKIKHAKERLTNALIGLVLALGSYTILYTVNPALVSLQLAPIKILRAEPTPDTSPPILKECDTNEDCQGLLSYTECTGGAGNKRTLPVAMTCVQKTAEERGIAKWGKCIINTGEICRIGQYTCQNIAGALATTLTFGLAGAPTNATTDFDGTLACPVGNTCIPTELFTQSGITAPTGTPSEMVAAIMPKLYRCKPSTYGDRCRQDQDCPTGTACLTPRTNPSQRFCGYLAGPKKAQGVACLYNEECESGRCNESTEVCTVVGGSPAGTSCSNDLECQSRICLDKLTGDVCAPVGGVALGESCANSNDCGRCSNFNARGEGTYPPSCTKTRDCINGVCATGPAADGEPCFENSDCRSRICLRGSSGVGICR